MLLATGSAVMAQSFKIQHASFAQKVTSVKNMEKSASPAIKGFTTTGLGLVRIGSVYHAQKEHSTLIKAHSTVSTVHHRQLVR